MKDAKMTSRHSKQLGTGVVEYEPMVKNKAGRVFIWIGVVLLASAAISTRNLALIIIAILSPGIAGVFTARGRVKTEPK